MVTRLELFEFFLSPKVKIRNVVYRFECVKIALSIILGYLNQFTQTKKKNVDGDWDGTEVKNG